MGLDMYLTASKYINSWEHNNPAEREQFNAVLRAVDLDEGFVDRGSPSGRVEVNVGYWRKANQIHRWFVNNVQGGKDECNPHYVEREQLKTLLKLCGDIIDGQLTPEEVLPTQSGFFFGSTDYDEWYMDGVKRTVEIIERCLTLPKDWTLEYRASW